jgi:hypothetical protein
MQVALRKSDHNVVSNAEALEHLQGPSPSARLRMTRVSCFIE